MYVYIESEHNVGPNGENLYTVGFYDPEGKFQPESDYNDKAEAAKRVALLNGSRHDTYADLRGECNTCGQEVKIEIDGRKVYVWECETCAKRNRANISIFLRNLRMKLAEVDEVIQEEAP